MADDGIEDDMERQARIMELAQQQQQSLDRITDIVENQRRRMRNVGGSRSNNNVGPHPAEQEEEEEEEEGEGLNNVPDEPLPRHQQPRNPRHHQSRQGRFISFFTFRLYFICSALFALLAVTSPASWIRITIIKASPTIRWVGKQQQFPPSMAQNDHYQANTAATVDGQGNFINRVTGGGWDAVVAAATQQYQSKTKDATADTKRMEATWGKFASGNFKDQQTSIMQQLMSFIKEQPAPSAAIKDTTNESKTWWLPPWEWIREKRDSSSSDSKSNEQPVETYTYKRNNIKIKLHPHLSPILRMINITSSQPYISTNRGGDEETEISANIFVTIIDKIFTSTARTMAVANLLLAVMFLLQTAVADMFLGPINTSNTENNLPPRNEASQRRRSAGREKFAGFLLFKSLIITSIVEPDNSIDLFILLLWYTLISFMRSCSHMAGATAIHASQSGEPPTKGGLHLLVLILVCDTLAAVGFVTVFYNIGWNMLLLLSCDCIMIMMDGVTHIMRYIGLKIEESHRVDITHLEERQLTLRTRRNNGLDNESDEVAQEGIVAVGERDSIVEDENSELEAELDQIDQAVQTDEANYIKLRSAIDRAVFLLEITYLTTASSHFIHMWSVHGTSYGLIDGIIALHLHSSAARILQKIYERRAMHRISREINNNFPDASDIDLRKAHAAGDVCCICLNSMLVGSVKKVCCGHLFHTNCLREVVERERSFNITKCPLCRASIVTGRHDIPQVVRPQVVGEAGGNTDNTQGQGQQSLLRFSTENFIPRWLPIPAFAFEVVRRETVVAADENPQEDVGVRGGWQRFFRRGGQAEDINAVQEAADTNDEDDDQEHDEQVQPQEQQPSFWRHLLLLLGFVHMTPEEEASALEQLTEMFPQYDRADLLRELRMRPSTESVAESILLGLFQGTPRFND